MPTMEKLIKKIEAMKPGETFWVKKIDWNKLCSDTPTVLLYKLSRNKRSVFYGRTYGSKPIQEDYLIIRARSN